MTRPSGVDQAAPDELPMAFRMLYRKVEERERSQRVGHALAMVRRGELDPAGVFVERAADGHILGMMVAHVLPGRAAQVWPPHVESVHGRVAREDALVRRVVAWLGGQGVRLAQALLSGSDGREADPLLRNDFRHITSLIYLRLFLGGGGPVSPAVGRPSAEPPGLRFQTYADADPDTFRRTLSATYHETLDCPEVNNVRSIDEVITGHQGQGRYDPRRWWLAFRDDRPAGVLMLTSYDDGGGWDLSYLGVAVGCRGRGVGRGLLVKAVAEARAGFAGFLSLAVDRRNTPAWELYRQFGFEPFDDREVFLAIWSRSEDACPGAPNPSPG